ncbi:MAG: hypothetical protein HKP52_00390 [Desulfofustis sp.]|nr:hypothetical protein [Desulfofustis sp.]NNK12679.1 hypothetical protein [Desulfofustis sp.]NNK55749.1 hypothetical protein [Desulfofustis sp.]RZW20124.1 MAG: hypothetical protein EX260_06965 [Desulfobulbaceae bacterium]
MILESWSIALITCSAVVIIFGLVGAATSLRLLKHWNLGSDSELQIKLEERIWLVATLVQFGLVVQIISAILFIYAADYFATVLKGAMCAAGSLTANGYGLPALGFKLITIFAGSLWIMVHRLDIGSEDFPYTRLKSYLLLGMLPLLIGDGLLVVLYLVNLEPEIVTSCCGIIFGDAEAGGYSLLNYSSETTVVFMLATISALILAGSLVQLISVQSPKRAALIVSGALASSWPFFYLLALGVITVQVSPYVYGLPHHRCPFDLLHYPYLKIGLPLYLFLHVAVLAGLGAATVRIISCVISGSHHVDQFVRRSSLVSMSMVLLFLLTAGWQPFAYMVYGGQ